MEIQRLKNKSCQGDRKDRKASLPEMFLNLALRCLYHSTAHNKMIPKQMSMSNVSPLVGRGACIQNSCHDFLKYQKYTKIYQFQKSSKDIKMPGIQQLELEDFSKANIFNSDLFLKIKHKFNNEDLYAVQDLDTSCITTFPNHYKHAVHKKCSFIATYLFTFFFLTLIVSGKSHNNVTFESVSQLSAEQVCMVLDLRRGSRGSSDSTDVNVPLQ